MTILSDAIADVRKSETWTQRLYYLSPVVEGAFKSLWETSGISSRKATKFNMEMAQLVEDLNARALKALNIEPGWTTIQAGPFAGMQYPTKSTGSLVGPKLIGRYEQEIESWVVDAIKVDYDLVMDVGSAEGYYAVGFAYANRSTQVRAYDADAGSQQLVATIAARNGVEDRVHVGGFCDHSELQKHIATARRALVIVDIEGYEAGLLDPSRAPALAGADMLVELHEYVRPGVTYRILDRFSATHTIDIICARDEAIKINEAVAAGMDREVAEAALHEGRRLPQLWLRMTAFSALAG